MKTLLVSILSLALCSLVSADEVKIELTGNDQMQYNTKSFEVTEGQKVVISFKHVGQLPVEAMGHNVVFLKTGTDVIQFATKSMTEKANEYIAQGPEAEAMILAHSKLLGGGQEDEVTFTAPAPGDYTYVCTFPGHFSIMQGVMTVKAK